MRIDPKYKVRHVAGEDVIVMQQAGTADMTQVVAFNSVALWLFGELQGRDFSTSDVVRLIEDNYEVDHDTAAADAAAWVEQLQTAHLLL